MSKKLLLLILIMIAIFTLWYFDLFDFFSLEQIHKLKNWISSFGFIAPLIFILIYILATILFLPGTPLTLLAGLIFGPILGTIYVSIASTIGACFAFIIARYIGRDYIETKFRSNSMFQKIDQGVKLHDWKMIAITRLVPLFPFNAQNYIYGLTDIPLLIYAFVSWLCMLPATFAYVSLAGSILAGDGNITTIITYISIAIALIIALSIVSKYIMKKHHIEKE